MHFDNYIFLEKLSRRSSSYIRGVRLQCSDETLNTVLDECVGKCSIDLLLESNANVNSCNISGLTVCHLTARQGNVQLFEVIVKHSADLSAKCQLGRTPLFEVRTVQMFHSMIQQGASLTVLDKYSNTLLHVFSQSNNINSQLFSTVLKSLRKDVNARNADRMTPLHLACSSHNVLKVKALCDIGADVDAIDSVGRNALHTALFCGNNEVAQLLIMRGIAVNLPDHSGYTPLHVAIRHLSDIETIRLIADHGQDVNFRDGQGSLPANIAVQVGHFGALKILLERSALIETELNQILYTNNVFLDNNDSSNNNTEFDTKYAHVNKMYNGERNVDDMLKVGEVKHGLPFHLSVSHTDPSIIQELMRQKVNLNAIDTKGFTALHQALRESKVKCAEQILASKRCDVNTTSTDGLTPLHDCILHCDDINVLNMIINHQVDFENRTPTGDTALHLALKHNRKEATNMLVKSGACLIVRDASGDTPCHIAVKIYDEIDCEDYLMFLLTDSRNNGDHVEERINSCLQLTDFDGKTILHHMIEKGYIELLTRLVAAIGHRDIDLILNVVDNFGYSVLHYATKHGHLSACTALIQAGATLMNVNKKPFHSVLGLAVAGGFVEIVDMLIRNGASIDVDSRNKDLDQHPLVLSLQAGYDRVTSVLLNTGMSINNVCNSQGQSALHLASASCSVETVKRIIEIANSTSSSAGYSSHHLLNLRDNFGQTALHMCIQNQNTDVLDLLIRDGSDLNQSDSLGNTPLHLCAALVEVSYVHADALITAGADIEYTNQAGRTSLHLAAQQSETDVLELLIANEANIDAMDTNRNTPLLVAILCGNIPAAEILLGYDADVKASDITGQSALHKAVLLREVKPSFIRQLIKRGARLTEPDANGKTPFDLASDDITSLLSQLTMDKV